MLEAHHLSKTFRVTRPQSSAFAAVRQLLAPVYETRMVVDDVNLTLGEGDLLGLLGPNGAGKSTIQKMLTGVLQPSAGHVQLDGQPAHADRVRFARQIGAVFGQRSQLWWDLPLADSFRVVRAIYQIPEAQFRSDLNALIEALDIGSLLPVKVRELSLGQRARGDLCAALLPRPRVLFLDEPTLGLDVEARNAFHDVVLARHSASGLSIVLTTHDVADIDALCERIAIIRAGQMLYEGSVTAAKDTLSDWQVLLCHAHEGKGDLKGITPPAGIKLTRHGGCITMRYDRKQYTSKSAVAWLESMLKVISWTPGEVSTSDMLLDLYTKTLDATPPDVTAAG